MLFIKGAHLLLTIEHICVYPFSYEPRARFVQMWYFYYIVIDHSIGSFCYKSSIFRYGTKNFMKLNCLLTPFSSYYLISLQVAQKTGVTIEWQHSWCNGPKAGLIFSFYANWIFVKCTCVNRFFVYKNSQRSN